MSLKSTLGLIFFVVVMVLLVFYWFIPLNSTNFSFSSKSKDLELGDTDKSNLQFYPNMRFTSPYITYNMVDCSLEKSNQMERAFDIIENLTILDFSRVSNDEQITVTCDSRTRVEEGLFIAGEGGPTNITQSGEFNVIMNGKILLLKESKCPNPNIGLHELMHVLGFDHVDNSNDLMYPVSKCDQEINPIMISLINNLYSISSYPDLKIEDASAVMNGKYLDVNMTVRNAGLNNAPKTKVKIYADDKLVKELVIDSLDIGHGRMISLTNIWVAKVSINQIILIIDTNFDELKKENNKVILNIKR